MLENNNKRVIIISHPSLFAEKIDGLIGMSGEIVEDFLGEDRNNKGYNIALDNEFEAEKLWFVHKDAVRIVE